jgi:hypothetical protein
MKAIKTKHLTTNEFRICTIHSALVKPAEGPNIVLWRCQSYYVYPLLGAGKHLGARVDAAYAGAGILLIHKVVYRLKCLTLCE